MTRTKEEQEKRRARWKEQTKSKRREEQDKKNKRKAREKKRRARWQEQGKSKRRAREEKRSARWQEQKKSKRREEQDEKIKRKAREEKRRGFDNHIRRLHPVFSLWMLFVSLNWTDKVTKISFFFSATGDSWFLDSVEVTRKGQTVYFPCQQWLSSSEGDKQVISIYIIITVLCRSLVFVW